MEIYWIYNCNLDYYGIQHAQILPPNEVYTNNF